MDPGILSPEMTVNQQSMWRSGRSSPGRKDEAPSADRGPVSAFCKVQQVWRDTLRHIKVSLHPHHPCQAAMGVTDRVTAQNQDHHGKAGRMSGHWGDGPDWRRNTDLNSRLS